MLVIVRFNFMLTQTPLGQVLLRITALSHAIAFFLVLLLLHGSPREAFVSHSNTEAELRVLATTTIEIYGFDGCLLILVFHVMFPHLFYVIILDP